MITICIPFFRANHFAVGTKQEKGFRIKKKIRSANHFAVETKNASHGTRKKT